MNEESTDGTKHELEDEIEVSVHHTVKENGARDYHEYEVHTGFQDEYRISEKLYRRVYADLGLDLKDGDYRSGCEIKIVSGGDYDE